MAILEVNFRRPLEIVQRSHPSLAAELTWAVFHELINRQATIVVLPPGPHRLHHYADDDRVRHTLYANVRDDGSALINRVSELPYINAGDEDLMIMPEDDPHFIFTNRDEEGHSAVGNPVIKVAVFDSEKSRIAEAL